MNTVAPEVIPVSHASSVTFRSAVLHSKDPVLVDFYADWCRPCQMLAPVLDEFAKQRPGVKIVKVNVDEEPELAVRYQISSIPALIVFKNGKPVAQHLGMANRRTLDELVK